MIKIYYKPNCATCQTALSLVKHETDEKLDLVEYLVETPDEKELARIMNTYWVNFAKTGNPNGKGLPAWPLYDTQKEEILDIELDGKPVTKPDPRKARLNVIEKAFKKRDRIQAHGI